MDEAKQADEASPLCIYCDLSGPFTIEHVFPAGIGGDDKNYLLRDLVCETCNTKVFSPLELKFMRSSPVAIARLFLQDRGRGSGKKTSIPTVDTRTTTFVDAATNMAVEANMQAGGKPVVLFQVLFPDEGVGLTGSDAAELPDFLSELTAFVNSEISLIEKNGSGKDATYTITTYSWNGTSGYQEALPAIEEKPTKNGLWKADLLVAQNLGDAIHVPRLFRRPTGGFVLRVPAEANITELLNRLRATLPHIVQQLPDGANSVPNPSVNMSFSMDMSAYYRVLAKIGVNLVAHTFGESYVRDTGFDQVKEAILTGVTPLKIDPTGNGEAFGVLFNNVPFELHAMALVAYPAGPRRCHLFFIIRLYGGASDVVMLGEDLPTPPIPLPVFFTVDYNDRYIECHRAEEFVAAFPPSFPSDIDEL